jgi:hypothetical protein
MSILTLSLELSAPGNNHSTALGNIPSKAHEVALLDTGSSGLLAFLFRFCYNTPHNGGNYYES